MEQDLLKNQASPLHYKEKAHGNSIESLSAHPNGSVFATGSHDTTIKIWDVSSFKETMTLSDHK